MNKTDGWWPKKKQQSKVDKLFQSFKEDVIKLEEDYDIFQAELKIQEQNPIIPVLELFVGIICVLVSIVWVLQMYINYNVEHLTLSFVLEMSPFGLYLMECL